MSQSLDMFGVIEKKGVPVVSSRKLAEIFNKRHEHVIRSIKEAADPKNGVSGFAQINFIESTYKDSTGRKQPEYLLTRDGFTLIAMGFSGKKAMQFKIEYINRFNEMEQFIETLNIARLEYPDFTNAILNAHEEVKPYHFSNEVNMINTICLGMTAKKFKEVNGLGDVQSIRPHLTKDQITAIEKLQKFDTGLILTEPDYGKRKEILTAYYHRISSIKMISNRREAG